MRSLKTQSTASMLSPVWTEPQVPHTQLEVLPVSQLKPHPRNARRHSKQQIAEIARSIEQFGFTNPVLIDGANGILAGHGRVAAAQSLGLANVPVVRLSHLSEVQKRAYVIADNKLAEKAGWDRETLAIELGELALLLPEHGLDLTITGFETAETDGIFSDFSDADPADDVPALASASPVTRTGDLWLLDRHRLLCADAREQEAFTLLMAGGQAAMVFTDPPYNVPIQGHVRGRSRVRHREFAVASGELSSEEFIRFLSTVLGLCERHSTDGSIHFVCMDWRHMPELLEAGGAVYTELKNICVWVKTSPGQGSFYRSQHELVFVFKKGSAAHVNTFELGQHGRTRTNVWTYPGVNSFKAGRADELAMHPTVKPVALVKDAILDCSRRGGIVLDCFMGSGTTIMAAERVGRRAYGIECDPAYVDVAIRRWQAFTRKDVVLAASGLTFAEVAEERAKAASSALPGNQTSASQAAKTSAGTATGGRGQEGMLSLSAAWTISAASPPLLPQPDRSGQGRPSLKPRTRRPQ